jgi:hypothetical protein
MTRDRRVATLIAGLMVIGSAMALAGCTTTSTRVAAQPLPPCPAGQEARRTAQLFFGRNVSAKAVVSEADFRKFVDEDVTPKFPDGLTVLDGGGQWRGEENRLIREASKVVMIVLPKGRDTSARVEAVRNAYKSRFHQDSVLLITQSACVSF